MVEPAIKVLRCFIALELPLEIQNELAQTVAALKRAEADVKWVEPDNVHLTLKFLGEIPHPKVLQIGIALNALAGEKAIPSRLAALGAFPNQHRPRVIWAGLDSGREQLNALQSKVEAIMSSLGFQREARDFSPHLTLGRVRSQRNLTALRESMEAIRPEPLSFAFRQLILMKSTLTPSGSIYQPVHTVQLGA